MSFVIPSLCKLLQYRFFDSASRSLSRTWFGAQNDRFCHFDRNEASMDPLDSLNLNETRRIIAEAIDKLPKNERMVMALYYYEELTMKEIGKAMGYTESRVSQLHTKAVLRLRAALQSYFDT